VKPLAALTALGAVLRFATLDVQSYWNDEAVTATLLDQGLGGLLSDIPDSESTPPLYYLLAWLWSRPFGVGEVGLRSLSALLGTLAVPVAYALGARLVSRRAGLVAGALVATNPLLVWYSQEARSYALLVLLAALTLLAAVAARERRRGALAAWVAVCVLALATHYFALFVVAPSALWLLAGLRRRALPAAAGVAAAGAVLLPLAIDQRSNGGAGFIEYSSLAVRLAQVPKQFLVGFDSPSETLLTAAAGALAAYAVWALARRAAPEDRRGALIAAVAGLAALGIPAVVALGGADYLITRNVIAALVPLLVALGAGFAAGRAGAAAAAALCALSAFVVVAVAIEPRYQRDDWRGAAEALGAPARDRVVVLTPPDGRVPLTFYLARSSLLPADGAAVAEVDAIGLAKRRPGEEASPPRGEAPVPAPPFRQVERIEEETFTLVRHQAPAPVLVLPAAAEVARLSDTGAALLVQRATPDGAAAARARRRAGR
jgi:hypothetical protein